ncbi:hypothetical protein ABVT39_006282 [Epinephelus coioides]
MCGAAGSLRCVGPSVTKKHQQELSCASAVLQIVAQLENVSLPPDTDVGPDPDLCPQDFESNAAATHQLLETMHRL